MMKKSEQLSVLESDAKVLEHTQRKGRDLIFPSEFMPDGEPYVAQTEHDNSVLEKFEAQNWVAAVRREYREREDRQNTETRRSRPANGRGEAGGPATTGESGAVGGDEGADGGSVETSVEELLRSRLGAVEEKLERAIEHYVSAQLQVETLEQERTKLVKLVGALDDSTDGEEDRCSDSTECAESESDERSEPRGEVAKDKAASGGKKS